MRGARAERNQRGAGGSGQATPPDGELGQAEAAGGPCIGGGSGRCDACAPRWGARTAPVVPSSAGFATTFGFGLGLGFTSAGSALASLGAAASLGALACLGAAPCLGAAASLSGGSAGGS